MTAEVLAFPRPADTDGDDREALLATLSELHALITLDPILGVSPVRVFFVLNPHAKARIATCLDGADARAADAYALVAYDFPFALHQLESTASRIPRERARDIVSCNAGLQRDTLRRAAEALGVEARPVVRFDAAELKTTFFPNTQETVIDLFRLRLRPA